jgi:hypothetical protein
MAEVVEDATSHWTDEDRDAVAEYLFTVEPKEGEPAPAEEGRVGRADRLCCAATTRSRAQLRRARAENRAGLRFRRIVPI